MLQSINRSPVLLFFFMLVLFNAACTNSNRQGTSEPKTVKGAELRSIPRSELNLAKDSAALLIAARRLLAADTNVAFITVDSSGRPRVRTVYAIVEEQQANTITNNTRIWVLTRAATRKVAQLQKDPRVTLYYNQDATISYASIMGIATVFTDPADPEASRFLRSKVDADMIKFFWPSFPQDFALLKIRPQWIEYLSEADAHADPKTWRPQAVVFPE